MADENARAVCPKHDALEVSLARIEHTTREGFTEISETLKAVHKDLREGAVTMGQLTIRISVLEKFVFSAIGLALAGLATALLSLVVRGGG